MLRDHLTDTDVYQLNLHERLVQLNLQERLRAPDLRVLNSLTFGAESMAAPLTYGAVQGL